MTNPTPTDPEAAARITAGLRRTLAAVTAERDTALSELARCQERAPYELQQAEDGYWMWRRGDEMWHGGYATYEAARIGAMAGG